VAGAVGILNSAYRHAGPQLESFVITSSVAAIVDPTKPKYAFSEEDWNTYSYDRAKDLGDEAPSGMLYQASKVAAERAVWEFKKNHVVRRTSHYSRPFMLLLSSPRIGIQAATGSRSAFPWNNTQAVTVDIPAFL